MGRNSKQAETTMSLIERYLMKHNSGDIITQRMIIQNCGIDKPTVARYIHYLIKVGLGKRVLDDTNGTTAMKFTPHGDQRTRKIAWRVPEVNERKPRGGKTTPAAAPAPAIVVPPPLPPAPKPAWSPTMPLAADPVLLEKFDLLITRVDTMITRLDRMVAAWEKA